ncbi:hypothetical protein MTO96_006454 [Rhipicephalus appendiculatus]
MNDASRSGDGVELLTGIRRRGFTDRQPPGRALADCQDGWHRRSWTVPRKPCTNHERTRAFQPRTRNTSAANNAETLPRYDPIPWSG